jgi:hypothetical protein
MSLAGLAAYGSSSEDEEDEQEKVEETKPKAAASKVRRLYTRYSYTST